MVTAERMLTYEELLQCLENKTRVKANALANIFDRYIVLTEVELVKDSMGIGTFEGIVDAVSDKPIRLTKPHSTLIFHDSYEKEENCEYE